MAADRPWEAVGYGLINGSVVSTLVGSTAIWLGEKPDPAQGYPCINFFPIGGKLLIDKGAITNDIYQISCRASAASDVMDVARAVEDDWQNFEGTLDGFDVSRSHVQVEGLIWEPEDEVYHVPVTLRLVYTSTEG